METKKGSLSGRTRFGTVAAVVARVASGREFQIKGTSEGNSKMNKEAALSASRRSSLACLAFATVLVMSGCLSHTYKIADEDLERIVSAPPGQRGGAVRVVQEWSTASDPKDDPSYDGRYSRSTSTYVYVGGSYQRSRTYRPVCQRRNCATPAGGSAYRAPSGGGVAQAGRPGGGAPVRAGAPGSGPVSAGPPGEGPVSAGPAGGGVESAPGVPRESGGSGAGQSGAGDVPSSSPNLGVGGDKDAIIALVAVAVAFTVVLAATEGMRYDGWLDLSPNQTVYVVHHYGSVEKTTLAALEPSDLLARKVIISRHDGELVYLGRAPLDRQGFAWRMEGGGMQMPTPNGETPLGWAFMGQVGYFPLQQLGILFSLWGGGGNEAGGEFVGVGYGLEVDVLPLQLWRVHGGVFGGAGYAYGAAEGGTLLSRSYHEPYLQAGVLAEVDITTRLGLSLRGGAHWQRVGGEFLPMMGLFSAGLTVY